MRGSFKNRRNVGFLIKILALVLFLVALIVLGTSGGMLQRLFAFVLALIAAIIWGIGHTEQNYD